MKKWNLVATFLGCALCTILMVGATYEPQPCFTDTTGEGQRSVAVASEASETSPDAKLEDEIDITAEAVAVPSSEEAETSTAVEPAERGSSKSTSDNDSQPAAQATSSSEVKKTTQKSSATKKAVAQNEDKVAAPVNDPDGNDAPAKEDNPVSTTFEKAPSKTCTITIDGVEMNYIDSYGTSSAPDSDAGIWRGSDSTTDGSYGYFIGHDYTAFGSVANIDTGSTVSVTDGNGDSRSYQVVDSFVVPEGSHWSDISDRVTGYGESIVMQTCVDGGYQIVVAE